MFAYRSPFRQKKNKPKRKKLIENNEDITDDIFLETINAQGNVKKYILVLRKVIAMRCRIPKEKIHPDTDTILLCNIGLLDDIEIIIEIEAELSINIAEQVQEDFPRFVKSRRLFFWGNRINWNSFGDYALAVGEHLAKNIIK